MRVKALVDVLRRDLPDRLLLLVLLRIERHGVEPDAYAPRVAPRRARGCAERQSVQPREVRGDGLGERARPCSSTAQAVERQGEVAQRREDGAVEKRGDAAPAADDGERAEPGKGEGHPSVARDGECLDSEVLQVWKVREGVEVCGV